jgi:hypothetical protein
MLEDIMDDEDELKDFNLSSRVLREERRRRRERSRLERELEREREGSSSGTESATLPAMPSRGAASQDLGRSSTGQGPFQSGPRRARRTSTTDEGLLRAPESGVGGYGAWEKSLGEGAQAQTKGEARLGGDLASIPDATQSSLQPTKTPLSPDTQGSESTSKWDTQGASLMPSRQPAAGSKHSVQNIASLTKPAGDSAVSQGSKAPVGGSNSAASTSSIKNAHHGRSSGGGRTRPQSDKLYSVGVDHFEALDAREVAQADHLSQWYAALPAGYGHQMVFRQQA